MKERKKDLSVDPNTREWQKHIFAFSDEQIARSAADLIDSTPNVSPGTLARIKTSVLEQLAKENG